MVEIEVLGNTHFLSSGGIVYFGVRNGLGYHRDDLFLYIIEHVYFTGRPDCKKTCAQDGVARAALWSSLKEMNSFRVLAETPEYLSLTREETARGLAESNNPGGHPFFIFRTKINIPEESAFIKTLHPIHLRTSAAETNFINTEKAATNKVVLVGHDPTYASQQSFYDAADTWMKGKGYKLVTSGENVLKTGKDAIDVLAQNGKEAPITEIYFSTHGAPYAIDFFNPGKNLYTSREQVMSLLSGEVLPSWGKNSEIRFISDIVQLVHSGCIAEKVIITLGGCLLGALPKPCQRPVPML
jgi:hypothetical protein